MTQDEELKLAYENLTAVQVRCTQLLEENRKLRRLVDFIRNDQCDGECWCCRDYLEMANFCAGAGS